MAEEQKEVIKTYKVERACESEPNVKQLVLRGDIDNTESVYTRTLIHLRDASLPDVVYDPQAAGIIFKENETHRNGGGEDYIPPRDNGGNGGKEPTRPTTPPENKPDEVMPSQIVSWDLFVILKYRQDWRPNGYGLGELVYSTSLMPNEELTLEVKTWETSKTQQDTEDTTDERNVSDIKNSNSESNEASTSGETKTRQYVDAKAGYSGFGFSGSIEAGLSKDVMTAQQEVAKSSREQSEQTTNEYRSTHKVKMSVSRETGSESKTTRKIHNINQAYTLNVNYYQVVQEYDVQLSLYAVTLALLGAEADLAIRTRYKTWWGDTANWITLGHMIRFTNSSAWIQKFTDSYGVSPIKILYEMWSSPLYYAAPANKFDSDGLPVPPTPEERKEFQATMLQYVKPTPGWIEPDHTGAMRWGYEVIQSQSEDRDYEIEVLEYLYQFLPYSVRQTVARNSDKSTDIKVFYKQIINLYLESKLTNKQSSTSKAATRIKKPAPSSSFKNTTKILFSGHFKNTELGSALAEKSDEWTENIVNELEEIRNNEIGLKDSWKAVLPTQGVYSDLSLGFCSGAEDYFEIQRQFDLDLKKLEIDKLSLDVEKLKLEKEMLENGSIPTSVIVENTSANTSVNLDIGINKTPAKVEIKDNQ